MINLKFHFNNHLYSNECSSSSTSTGKSKSLIFHRISAVTKQILTKILDVVFCKELHYYKLLPNINTIHVSLIKGQEKSKLKNDLKENISGKIEKPSKVEKGQESFSITFHH